MDPFTIAGKQAARLNLRADSRGGATDGAWRLGCLGLPADENAREAHTCRQSVSGIETFVPGRANHGLSNLGSVPRNLALKIRSISRRSNSL